MKKLLWLVVLFFPVALVAAPAPNGAVEPKDFIRLTKEDGKIESLDIAVTRYEDKENKVKVDLVGVVHIGDTGYYKKLDKLLAKYEVVLYELVAPEGTKPKRKQKDGGLASLMPKLMSAMLDLDMQLEAMDYDKKNFVHADMSWEEMMKEAEKRGDTPLTLGLSLILDNLRQANKNKKKAPAKEVDFMQGLENPNLLKQQMAQQMVDNLEMGETITKLLIDDRNKKCCDVLDKQIKAGKKSIAIFYGAAHNKDFDKRLRKDRKFVCTGQVWMTAWGDLNGDPVPPEIRLLKLLMKKR